jgi:hypothetical protein
MQLVRDPMNWWISIGKMVKAQRDFLGTRLICQMGEGFE